MWLPVMNYKNEAIANPDARAISDTKMRCLVKAFAVLGLGHYIYAGEDLPSNDPQAIATKLARELRRAGAEASKRGVSFSDALKERVRVALDQLDIDAMASLKAEIEEMTE
jgi:hypothetical protein